MKRLGLAIAALLVIGWVAFTLLTIGQSDEPFIAIQVADGREWWVAWGLLAFLLTFGLLVRTPTRQAMLQQWNAVLADRVKEGLVILRADGQVLYGNAAGNALISKETTRDTVIKLLPAWPAPSSTIRNFVLDDGQRYRMEIVPIQRGLFGVVLRPAKSAQDKNPLYDNFIRRIVHDLRNPLAGIIGHTANLRHVNPGEIEKWQESTEIIEKEAQRLARLVDSMLFDARLAYVPLNMEKLDLLDLAEEALFAHEATAMANRQQIDIEADDARFPFKGDRDLLLRAFSNLVENGLKYGGNQILIKLRRIDQEYRLEFCDDGGGISAEYLPHKIFDSFVRASAGTSGSGLGLSIVRRIVEMHHGSVRADSDLGNGTTMTINLPIIEDIA